MIKLTNGWIIRPKNISHIQSKGPDRTDDDMKNDKPVLVIHHKRDRIRITFATVKERDAYQDELLAQIDPAPITDIT